MNLLCVPHLRKGKGKIMKTIDIRESTTRDWQSRFAVLAHPFGAALLASVTAIGCAFATAEDDNDLMEDTAQIAEPLSAATNVTIDEGSSSCQAVTIKFSKVSGATYYQLYRDTFVVRNVADADVGTGIADWSITPSSGKTYSYRVGASKVAIEEGSQFTGATSNIAPLSSTVSYRATASRCNIRNLLKRVVVLPLFPSDVTTSSSGVLTNSRMDALFGANTSTSMRGYFLEISNGAWAPQFVRLAAQSLPNPQAAYATGAARGKLSQHFVDARDAAIAANPSLALGSAGTQFIMIVMGSNPRGGEKGGAIIRLANYELRPEYSVATSLATPIHELGHVTFEHATYMTCTSPAGARFGVQPTLGLRDGSCVRAGSAYADRSDPMGKNARHYSGYSKHVIGFLGNMIQLRALVGGGNNVHKYRLHTSSLPAAGLAGSVPGDPSRTATQLIQFTNDRVVVGKKGVIGGDYWIEFKDERGFNNPAVTGESNTIGAGVVVQFRPAWPLMQMTGGVQTLVASGTAPGITKGETWLLDETSGLTIEVTDVQSTYADITMKWK
ncbi:MAG: hypothetical protein JW940_02275 [Polyangiaceae bacterium]|nr:hypothetical protein [Polyangiaceae bacterium]